MNLFRRKGHPADRRLQRTALGTERPGRAEETDWRSYDGVAAAYATVAEHITEPAARDLVSLLEIPGGALVLDVGTGTGGSARAAASGDRIVVGIDPSFPMLQQARARAGGPRYAAATAIDLPFRDGTFRSLIANFVLSHFARYDTALFDMLRVLASGGRIGVSNWAKGEDRDDFTTTWEAVAEEFAEREMLTDAHDRGVPWEERFSDPDALKDALHQAGVRDIWVEQREYRVEMTQGDYLAAREVASAGRFLRQMLGEELWETFRRRAADVFAQRFPDPFNDFHRVVLAVGHKP